MKHDDTEELELYRAIAAIDQQLNQLAKMIETGRSLRARLARLAPRPHLVADDKDVAKIHH